MIESPSIPSEESPNLSILDNGMNEREGGKEVKPDHIKILKEQIESAETSHFDTAFVELLSKISKNGDKSDIARTMIDRGVITIQSLGSKVAGVLGSVAAGNEGSQLTTRWVSEYLTEKFTISPETVKAIPGNAASSLGQTVEEAARGISPEVTEAAKSALTNAGDFFNSVAGKAKDLLGDDVVQAGSEAVKTISQGTSQGIDSTVEGINHVVVEPAVESTAQLAGTASWLPSAAIGYILASGAVGGAARVAREIREEHSFSHFQELIDQVNSFDIDNNPESFEGDPRIKLMVEFKRILESPDKTKYHFTKEEWLQFTAAAREAKCSLLRSKTRASNITLPEEQSVLEHKRILIDSILLNTQSELAEADRDLALHILTQFDNRLTYEMTPLEKEMALGNTLSRKLLRYSQSFVKGGINATGIPLLWRGFKKSALFVAKAILPI